MSPAYLAQLLYDTEIYSRSCLCLQEMVSVSPAYLGQLLCDTETYAKSVQEACQRHLDEREQATEAMDLLKLYQKARDHSPYVGDDDQKRKKFAHT